MKYVTLTERGVWDFRLYFEYVTRNRHMFLPHIFDFVSNLQNFDLASPSTLHDAWLETFTVDETPIDRHNRSISVTSRYLGARHDRRIHFIYRDVTAYSFDRRHEPGSLPGPQMGHGDVLVHEMIADGENLYRHEILFSSGSTFCVSFGNMAHHVEEFPTP